MEWLFSEASLGRELTLFIEAPHSSIDKSRCLNFYILKGGRGKIAKGKVEVAQRSKEANQGNQTERLDHHLLRKRNAMRGV